MKIKRKPGENWDAGNFLVHVGSESNLVILHPGNSDPYDRTSPRFNCSLNDLQAIIDWATKTDSELLRKYP